MDLNVQLDILKLQEQNTDYITEMPSKVDEGIRLWISNIQAAFPL